MFTILAQKKKYENVEHHTIKFGNKYKEHLDDIFNNKKLNDDISYYLHRPSSTDKSMAPEGMIAFMFLYQFQITNQILIGLKREKKWKI